MLVFRRVVVVSLAVIGKRTAFSHKYGYSPGLLCMMPPSAKIVVAVM